MLSFLQIMSEHRNLPSIYGAKSEKPMSHVTKSHFLIQIFATKSYKKITPRIPFILAITSFYRTKVRTTIKYFVVSKLKSIETGFEMTYNQGIERCHNLVSLTKGEKT